MQASAVVVLILQTWTAGIFLPAFGVGDEGLSGSMQAGTGKSLRLSVR